MKTSIQIRHTSYQTIVDLVNTADDLFDKGKFKQAIQYYAQVINHTEGKPIANLTYALYMKDCANREIDKAKNKSLSGGQAKVFPASSGNSQSIAS